MPREDLGTAYIRVRANTRGLAQQLRREVQQSFRESGDTAGTAFNDSFERRIQNLSNRMDRVVSQQGRNSGDTFAEGFNRSASQRIENVTRDLTRVVAPRMETAGDDSGRSFGRGFRRGFSLDFGPTNLVFDSFRQALIRLGPLVVAVGEAVVGLSAQAAALASSLTSALSASAAFLPVFGTLAQSITTLVVGFQGFGDAVSEGGVALAALGPNARAAAQSIRDLSDEWNILRANVQSELFEGFSGSVQRLANAYLPSLQRGLSNSADILSDFFQEFSLFASTERNVRDFNTALDSQNVILESLLDSVRPMAEAFRDFYVELLPFAERLADAIQRGTERLSEFAAQGRETGAIADFFERAFDNAENLLAGIRDLTVGITNFFAAGREEGAGMLATFADLSARFREFSQSVEGQQAFQEFFEFGAVAMERLGSVLRSVGSILGPVVNLTRDFLSAIAPLQPAVEDLASAAGQLISDGFGPLLEILADVTSAISGPITSAVSGLASAFEAIPGPVLATVAALTALRRINIAGIALTAIGPFQRFGQQMQVQASLAAAAGTSVTNMGAATATAGVRMGRAAAGVRSLTTALGGPFVVAITAAVTAVTAISDAISQSDDELQEWGNSLTEDIPFDDVDAQLSALRSNLEDLRGQADTDEWDALANHLIGWETGATQAAERADWLRERIAELEEQQASEAEQTREQLAAIEGVSDAQARYAQQTGITTEELRRMAQANQETIQSFVDGADSFTDVLGAWETASQSAAEQAAESAGESADAWQEFADDAEVSLDQFRTALEEQVEAQQNWATNLSQLASRVPPEVLEHLAGLGAEAAPLIQELVDATGAELQELIPLIQQTMPGAAEELGVQLSRWSAIAGPAADRVGQDVIDRLGAQIAAGQLTVAEAARQIGVTIEQNTPDNITIRTRLNTGEFYTDVSGVQETIDVLNGSRPTVTADMSPTPFNDALAGVNSSITLLDSERPTPTADLSPTPFNERLATVDTLIDGLDAERPTPDANMNLDQFLARNRQANGVLSDLDGQRPTPVADAEISPLARAINTAQETVDSLRGKTVTAEAQTEGLGAVQGLYDAISSLFDRTVTVTTQFLYQGTPPPEGIRAPGLADGGIVTSPTFAALAENGDPEVVVPLRRPQRARQLAEESGLLDILGGGRSGSTVSSDGRSVTVMPGAVQFTAPITDPQRAAEATVDRLVIETTR